MGELEDLIRRFFSCFCEQNLGLGFFFVSQICWVFFGVSLLRFSYLLSLFLGLQKFLGFVGFIVQIGLLDLGLCLDVKKIAKKML